VLHDLDHVDEAPATVDAKLLDQGVYLASTSTMYRILRAEGEVHERRRQATHPPAAKPELLATQPNAMLARAERASLAERPLADTIAKQRITGDQLTIHADRGTSMASKPVAFLLADLGVTKSHSRPHCSNDNPYSETQFKTLKQRPEFPDRFGRLEDAHAFYTRFFRWYNHDHRHSGIAATHPERFVRKPPTPPELPTVAWINKPEQDTLGTTNP
jgi:putative transposase